MILVSILAATCVIGIVHSAPTSTYQRRQLQDDRPGLLFLNQIHGLEDADLFESGPGRSVGGTRTKRLGSLSIVNPLDVLRQRVLLELARRKMRQNQRQVDANRRFLETIGKRAVPNAAQFGINSVEDRDPADYASTQTNDYLYTFRVPGNGMEVKRHLGQQQHRTSDRGTERHLIWENHGVDPVVQQVENDQARMMANELNLL